MQTRIDEIAAGIYRLSDVRAGDRAAGRLHLQPVSRPRRRADAVPLRAARHVPARVRSGRPAHAARAAALDRLRPRRGRRMRRDEPVARRSAAARRWCTARPRCMVSLNDLADRAAARAEPTARCSISAASACARSTRRMCRTAGRPACSSRRRPAPCCAATCSPMSATARRSPTSDIVGPAIEAEDAVPATPASAPRPRQHPQARRARAAHARGDARRLLSTATAAGRCMPSPTIMTPSSAPRCWRAPREAWRARWSRKGSTQPTASAA